MGSAEEAFAMDVDVGVGVMDVIDVEGVNNVDSSPCAVLGVGVAVEWDETPFSPVGPPWWAEGDPFAPTPLTGGVDVLPVGEEGEGEGREERKDLKPSLALFLNSRPNCFNSAVVDTEEVGLEGMEEEEEEREGGGGTKVVDTAGDAPDTPTGVCWGCKGAEAA